MNNKPEIKLKVGNKYIIKNTYENPYIYIGNSSDFGFINSHYLFLDVYGNERSFSDEDFTRKFYIEERLKKTIEGYVVYADHQPHPDSLLDVITGLYTDGQIYASHEIAKLQAAQNIECKQIKKFKFIGEEIPE